MKLDDPRSRTKSGRDEVTKNMDNANEFSVFLKKLGIALGALGLIAIINKVSEDVKKEIELAANEYLSMYV